MPSMTLEEMKKQVTRPRTQNLIAITPDPPRHLAGRDTVTHEGDLADHGAHAEQVAGLAL